MKKLTFTLGLILLTFTVVFAQKKSTGTGYVTAIGAKFYPTAFTIKHRIDRDVKVEGLMYFWNGARITGLVEWYHYIQGLPGLTWYFGPGGHIQFTNKNTYYFGIDGVIGLDWKIKNVPLNFSLDWQPSYDIGTNGGFRGGFGGLGIRYVIK
jgi:hypothetical protein